MNIGETRLTYIDNLFNKAFSKAPLTENTVTGTKGVLNKHKYLISQLMGSNRDKSIMKFRENLIESFIDERLIKFDKRSDITLCKALTESLNGLMVTTEAFIEKCEEPEITAEVEKVQTEIRNRVIDQIDNTNLANSAFNQKAEDIETEINNKITAGETSLEDREKEIDKAKETLEESHKKTLINHLTETLYTSLSKNYKGEDITDEKLLTDEGVIEAYRVIDYATECYIFLETINTLGITKVKFEDILKKIK